MGQRLNLEIRKKGKVLANCYFHWSAYTAPSYELTEKVYHFIINNYNDIADPKLLAIKAFESLGAGMEPEEIEYMRNNKKYCSNDFNLYKNRNEGIIGVSPKGIRSTQEWAEEDSIIEISNFNDIRFHFNVFNFEESIDFYIDEYIRPDFEEGSSQLEAAIASFKSKIVPITLENLDDGFTFKELSKVCQEICDNDKSVLICNNGYLLNEIA
jgi:hypothetical protein